MALALETLAPALRRVLPNSATFMYGIALLEPNPCMRWSGTAIPKRLFLAFFRHALARSFADLYTRLPPTFRVVLTRYFLQILRRRAGGFPHPFLETRRFVVLRRVDRRGLVERRVERRFLPNSSESILL
jgi:hypothetical protein